MAASNVARRLVPMLAALVVAGVLAGGTAASAGTAQNYLVLYKDVAVPSDAATQIEKAGGTLVHAYPQIGVALASSSSSTFRSSLMKDTRVEGAAATSGFATQLPRNEDAGGPSDGDLPNVPATDSDTLSGLQWDMRQIRTPQAHAITGGSPSVLVGDIDTGLDKDHPDLQANIDFAHSASCLSGVPDTDPAAWDDHNGHGTHTAGTIAAASNGLGIVGVAPNVRIAGIKAGNDAGFFFPEAVICAFVWAGQNHMDVTNNSYFADPWLFNCRNDPEQRAIWKAEQRAIQYAEVQGVTVVAAEGNQSEDLSHPSQDATSPDDTTPTVRRVTNACAVIPVEVPGVVGVTADGHNPQDGGGYLKSFYSSFGISTADVVAPGGDSRYGVNPEATNGRVLSTYPAELPCLRRVVDGAAAYCYLQGTSMASPHVAGIAALIMSVFGTGLSPGQVNAAIKATAVAQPCPSSLPAGYSAVLGVDDGKVQTCDGGPGHNSWYGEGQADALNAITHAPA